MQIRSLQQQVYNLSNQITVKQPQQDQFLEELVAKMRTVKNKEPAFSNDISVKLAQELYPILKPHLIAEEKLSTLGISESVCLTYHGEQGTPCYKLYSNKRFTMDCGCKSEHV